MSHVTDDTSPTDTMNNFLFGEGSDGSTREHCYNSSGSFEDNGEGDEEDDEAAALAMALAMSVNLNSDGGDQRVEGQRAQSMQMMKRSPGATLSCCGIG